MKMLMEFEDSKGIKFVIGRLKGEEKTTVQTVLFNKSKWTVERAKEWLKNNDMHSGKVDEPEEGEYIRFRQKNPEDFQEGSFRTISAGKTKKTSEDNENSFYYLIDISDIELEEKDGKKTSWVEIFRTGKWHHPKYGLIEGTKKLFNDFINNWKNNILGRDIAIDKTHDPSEGATGWIKDLKIVGEKLKAFIEWTPWGIELIEQKGFKYFSPEYRSEYKDKESEKIYKNVLMGGAITNRPFLTNLSPIILSEDINIFQEYKDDLKEEFWLCLQEYADHDEEKVKNIMNIMKDHMQEMMNEMKSKNGQTMVRSIIKNHMQQMMKEMIEQMDWVNQMNKSEIKEVKSKY